MRWFICVGLPVLLVTSCAFVKTPSLAVTSFAQNVLVNSATASGEWTTVLISPTALDDEWRVEMVDEEGVMITSEKTASEGHKTNMWSGMVGALFGFLGGLWAG